MEVLEQKQKRIKQVYTDRIVLDQPSMNVIKEMASQVESAFGGVVKLTSKEIANFLIQNRASTLSNFELKVLKEQFFDEIQATEWALAKLKAAKASGTKLKLSEVLKEFQTPPVKEKQSPKTAPEKKSLETKDVSKAEIKSQAMGSLGHAKGATNS